jgi:hypothetical protein
MMPGIVETTTEGFRYAALTAARGAGVAVLAAGRETFDTRSTTAETTARNGRKSRTPWSAYCRYSVSDCPAGLWRDDRLSRPG